MAGPIDWDRIEIQYRAGIMTLREIATEHGITHGSINKRAKRDGWTRDLAAKIQAKAAALVSKQEAEAVSREASKASRLVTEREIVDAGAQKVADVLVGHKRIAADGLAAVEELLAELRTMGAIQEDLLKLGELMRDPEAKTDKLNEAYHKIISWGGRQSGLKGISESAKNFVGMQREVYGIVAEPPKPPDDSKVDREDLARSIIFMLSQRLTPS